MGSKYDNSAVDRIAYDGDSRVQWRTATLNGRKYAYIYGEPETGKWKATIFLLHGFPDLAMGWRYQIPHLLKLGFRIVAPDQLGYGRSEAPNDYREYAFKRIADDFKQLAHQLGESQIVLCGHDWGAALSYAICHHQRSLVSHIITVCVPYAAPHKSYIPLEKLVSDFAPSLGYQLQFRSGEVEKVVRTKEDVQQFLRCLYGAKTAGGGFAWDISRGVALEKLGQVQEAPLLKGKDLDFYATEYHRHGVHGPLNWYRLREINFQDERPYVSTPKIEIPALFIPALRDLALPPQSMGKSMARYVSNLTVQKVNTTHWAMIEDPTRINEIIGSWLGKHFPDKPRSVL